jgi:hypothetical protein
MVILGLFPLIVRGRKTVNISLTAKNKVPFGCKGINRATLSNGHTEEDNDKDRDKAHLKTP